MKKTLLAAILTLFVPILFVTTRPTAITCGKKHHNYCYSPCYSYRQQTFIQKKTIQPKVNQVAEFIYDVTVTIEAGDSSGAGVLISPDGYILTAAHIMRRGSIWVRTQNGKLYLAELIHYNPKKDLSLLKIRSRRNSFRYVNLSNKYTLKNSVYLSGYPDFRKTIIGGLTNEKAYRSINGNNIFVNQVNARIKPGFSGGGVFDARTGVLNGILVAYEKNKSVSYSVCLEDCRKIVQLANQHRANYNINIE